MTARPIRLIVVLVCAVAATWFVARPVLGAASRDAIAWYTGTKDGPLELTADSDGVVLTTSEGPVYLLDTQGEVRWHAAVAGTGPGRPALDRDVVVVGGMTVTALARSDGTIRWHLPRAATANSLALTGDTVLVGDDSGTLAAVEASTGEPRWEVRYPGMLWSGARVDVASGAVVAAWHQSESSAVRVFDVATGALRWEAPLDRFSAAPAVHGRRVVLAIGDGYHHARVESRDLASGEVQWQTAVPRSFLATIEPAVDDDAVAVVDHSGVMSVLDPASGELRWQRDLDDEVLAARVVLTGTRVAFTSYAGVLHVLDRRDGHVVHAVLPRRLGGYVVASAPVPWPADDRGGGVLLALRLRDWGVQLRRLK